MAYFDYDTLGSLTEIQREDGSYNMFKIIFIFVVIYLIFDRFKDPIMNNSTLFIILAVLYYMMFFK